ncbi:hypothetical protein DNTS_035329, partial [Danionella cerebrum]
MFAGVFGNKQDSVFLSVESALQMSPNSLLLPALDASASLSVLNLVQEELGVQALSVHLDSLKKIQLNGAEPALLAIHLPYTAGSQLKETLLKNDKIIGEVLELFRSQDVPYTAIYTGLKASRMIEDTGLMVESSMGRALLQTTPPPSVKAPLVFNSSTGQPCIMLWADTLLATYLGEEVDLGRDIFNGSADTTGSFCNETVSRLVLNYKN